jgi:hypothetical protein
VVVQPLQDLFVRHPAPRFRLLPRARGGVGGTRCFRCPANHNVAHLFFIVEL